MTPTDRDSCWAQREIAHDDDVGSGFLHGPRDQSAPAWAEEGWKSEHSVGATPERTPRAHPSNRSLRELFNVRAPLLVSRDDRDAMTRIGQCATDLFRPNIPWVVRIPHVHDGQL
jgi:hypothetical protein